MTAADELIRMVREKAASRLEDTLAWGMRCVGLPEMERQYKWADDRKWTADFADVDRRLLVYVDGGDWKRGRHVRPQGRAKDCEARNEAQLRGWTCLVFTTDMVLTGDAVRVLERFYERVRRGEEE